MKFCPFWVLGVVSTYCTRQYVDSEGSLAEYARNHASILQQHYDDTTAKKLMDVSEGIMNFLVEIEAEDVLNIFDSYIYFKTTFDEKGDLRRIKTLFKSALSASNEETTSEDIVRSFRAFTFRYRSNDTMVIPIGWQLHQVDRIGWLGDLFDE